MLKQVSCTEERSCINCLSLLEQRMHLVAAQFFACPLTAGVFGTPLMTPQTASSIFSLFSTDLWDLLNLRPVHSLMLSSHLFLSFSALSSFPFHCALQDVFWPDLLNGRHAHKTSLCVSLRSSGGFRVDLGTDFLVDNEVFV